MTNEVWLLADDRAGNVNQLLGVAEQLGLPFEQKKIVYSKWAALPNWLQGAGLIGVTPQTKEQLKPPYPRLVIGAGRRVFPIARYIKKMSGGETKIVQLMNPGAAGFKEADLVVIPMHDDYKGTAQNVMRTLGAPHRVTKEKLAQEQKKWRETFQKYPEPRLSVIVGGATKRAPFTVEMAQNLAAHVLALNPGSVLVTTSRRTPADVVAVLKNAFPKETTYFYQFGDSGENPYFGLLAWGGQIVVTGDSMSMCSESCASGVPVYIFAPKGTMGKKHMRFHEQLYRSGYATALGSGQIAFGGSLNAAEDIAQKIKSILGINDA